MTNVKVPKWLIQIRTGGVDKAAQVALGNVMVTPALFRRRCCTHSVKRVCNISFPKSMVTEKSLGGVPKSVFFACLLGEQIVKYAIAGGTLRSVWLPPFSGTLRCFLFRRNDEHKRALFDN